jgi:hypothetical protein
MTQKARDFQSETHDLVEKMPEVFKKIYYAKGRDGRLMYRLVIPVISESHKILELPNLNNIFDTGKASHIIYATEAIKGKQIEIDYILEGRQVIKDLSQNVGMPLWRLLMDKPNNEVTDYMVKLPQTGQN